VIKFQVKPRSSAEAEEESKVPAEITPEFVQNAIEESLNLDSDNKPDSESDGEPAKDEQRAHRQKKEKKKGMP